MTAVAAPASGSAVLRQRLQRHAWTVGVWVLLAAMVAWYTTLVPRFGGFEVSSILRSALPLAFLALAQAVIVIGGGIDLSIGAMLVLANVLCARLMEPLGTGPAVAVAVGVVVVGAVLNGGVGWIINRSGIPDIVVTLATSFVLGGVALQILPSPGGGMPGGLRYLFTGSEVGIGTNPWPSLVVLVLPVLVMWRVMRHTRTGLTVYAVGSSRDAAFLSGLDVGRAKIAAYAIGGALAALAGIATTAITGGGDPRFTIGTAATLNSVAAVVLGGVALTGGVGSAVGAVAAGVALFLLSPILTGLRVDPNQAQVVQGVLIVLVVMVGGLYQSRLRRAAS